MKTVAVIPVKFKSERVPLKNFRNFYKNKSLLDILLDKLLKIKKIEKIFISTDNKKISLKSYNKNKRIEVLIRDKKLCNNKTPWSDVIYNVVDQLPVKDNVNVMWCHTTTPLFDDYNEALEIFLKNKTFNGLVAVSKIKEFLIGQNKIPINYSWGNWHKYSQHMPDIYAVSGALFICKKKEFIKNRYVISTNPYFFESSSFSSLDIDNLYEFELARILFQNKKKFKKLNA